MAEISWHRLGGAKYWGAKCTKDGADVFDVAGMHRAGKKVVGLALLERGQCPSGHMGTESKQ